MIARRTLLKGATMAAVAATTTAISIRPGDAHAEDYRLFQKRIGTTRNVIVTPSTYGTDNSCTLDALATLGSTARAIAVVDTRVTDAELERLNGLGVRGMRFMLNPTSPTT